MSETCQRHFRKGRIRISMWMFSCLTSTKERTAPCSVRVHPWQAGHFIDDVRELEKKTEYREDAVRMAIDMHPCDSPIKTILEEQKSEVMEMFLTDWNEEEYREVIKEEAREEGLAEGREKGRAESCIETARRMLADGLSNEKVAEYSGLTLEEVQKLAAGK